RVRHVVSRIAIDLARGRGIQYDRRYTRRDGIEGRQAETLVRREERERRRAPVQVGQLGVGDEARHGDAIGYTGMSDLPLQFVTSNAACVARDDEPDIAMALGQSPETCDELRHVTPRQDRPHI